MSGGDEAPPSEQTSWILVCGWPLVPAGRSPLAGGFIADPTGSPGPSPRACTLRLMIQRSTIPVTKPSGTFRRGASCARPGVHQARPYGTRSPEVR